MEIKPCPFCGGEGRLEETIMGRPIEYFIGCRNCGIETRLFKTSEEALEFWNTRKG